jgi:hypothetical protein
MIAKSRKCLGRRVFGCCGINWLVSHPRCSPIVLSLGNLADQRNYKTFDNMVARDGIEFGAKPFAQDIDLFGTDEDHLFFTVNLCTYLTPTWAKRFSCSQ